jgi:hypothetical protein
MEAVEGYLEWGLRGVKCVAGGGGYFRDGCSRVFWKRVRLMGTSGETDAEGREERTLTGVQDLGLAQAEAKQPEQGDGGMRGVRATMQITQPVKALDGQSQAD